MNIDNTVYEKRYLYGSSNVIVRSDPITFPGVVDLEKDS